MLIEVIFIRVTVLSGLTQDQVSGELGFDPASGTWWLSVLVGVLWAARNIRPSK